MLSPPPAVEIVENWLLNSSSEKQAPNVTRNHSIPSGVVASSSWEDAFLEDVANEIIEDKMVA